VVAVVVAMVVVSAYDARFRRRSAPMGRDQGGRMRCRICRGDMDRRGEGEGVFRVVVGWSVVVSEYPSAVESSGSGSGRGGEARARAVPASEV
jgi:hypothetical protein